MNGSVTGSTSNDHPRAISSFSVRSQNVVQHPSVLERSLPRFICTKRSRKVSSVCASVERERERVERSPLKWTNKRIDHPWKHTHGLSLALRMLVTVERLWTF